MNDLRKQVMNDRWILSHRGKKNNVDPLKPYAWLVEKERTVSGKVENVATIFLTNRECPFHCLMCDLWKNTTSETVAEGAIPGQIEWALNHLPDAKHLKLYNSGSFFDRKAIPEKDYPAIASLTSHFETVIVESHPTLIDERCLSFRDMLKSELQIAMGLETVHPEILSKLCKKMTTEDYRKSALFLAGNDIKVRAFILLRPPFMTEEEGIIWAERSLDFAFSSGVECCVVIPVRTGNGTLDLLQEINLFSPPSIKSLEKVTEYGIRLKKGRVFADTWDLKLFSTCTRCTDLRIDRISEMNLTQEVAPPVICSCDTDN